jgi:carboxyl-terminal processing protease
MSKGLKYFLIVLITMALLAGAFSAGVISGWALPMKSSSALSLSGLPGLFSSSSEPNGGTPKDLQKIFAPFWEAWTLVHNQYVDQPVDNTKLMQGAIQGMLASLGDPHTSYMSPQQYKQANASLGGGYEGIGAWVDTTGEYLTIIGPMPNSPAEKADLRAGDQIVAVDGKDMKGVDGSIVLQNVLGPAGTNVILTINRKGEEKPFDVTIQRSKIDLPSANGKMLDSGIGYIQIYTFGDKTMPELQKALNDIMLQHPKGLIIDLRNNGGGYLVTAIDVVSQFIKGDQLAMLEKFGDGTEKTYKTKAGGVAIDIPIVVLVNEGTASASEITAGAIQDYGRGKLVGVKTYGKGSVQNWTPLQDDQGAIRVTIARWLTPKGRQINKVGLQPDVTVNMTPEDIKAKIDPQLQKAIDLLLNSNH